jgi:glyoxylase-like metal-dependent hydrolase (beta-lactamase superfamily II)
MGQFEKRQVGNATMIALQDSWAALPPSAFFGAVEESAWAPYRDLLDGDGNIILNLGAWLVQSGGQTILIDTGIGGRPVQMPMREPAELPTVMQAAGVAPDDVDIVVFSHLHFDHTGWNTVDEGDTAKPLFANARHLVQQVEWDHWTGGETERAAARYDDSLAPLEQAGLIDFVDGEHEVTSELVAIPTPGHTPGHMSFVLQSDGERTYFLGDAAHHPVQLTEPTWSPNADIDPVLSAESRAALFERIERENALIASGHFEYPGLGHAQRDGESLRWLPLEAGE